MSIVKTYNINTDVIRGKINHTRLEMEIRASEYIVGFVDISSNQSEIKILGTSITDEPALDALILNHTHETLAELKARRNAEIDTKTGELISYGFTYDSIQFSLSELAQLNWIGLKQADVNNLITYPFNISTKDDDEYSLASSSDVTSFYIAGLGTKITLLAGGRSIKLQIKNAADETAVNSILDNR